MRHKLLVLLLVCFLLFSACNKKSESNQSPEFSIDSDFQYFYLEQGWNKFITESPDGYYIVLGNFLFFCDKDSMNTVPLCNKPDCLHMNETDSAIVWHCNAFLPTADGIEYYDNNLFTTNSSAGEISKYQLSRISKDGSNREVIYESSQSISMIVHRGYAYVQTEIWNDELKSTYEIISLDLSKNDPSPKTLYTGTYPDGNMQDMIAYGNTLFFNEYTANESKHSMINLLTLEVSEIFSNGESMSGISKDYIYYRIYSPEKETYWRKSRLDMSVEELTLPVSYTKNLLISDEKYRYTFNRFAHMDDIIGGETEKMSVVVLDDSMNKLREINVDSLVNGMGMFLPGYETHAFLDSGDAIYVLDKTKLLDVDTQFELLIDYDKLNLRPDIVVPND